MSKEIENRLLVITDLYQKSKRENEELKNELQKVKEENDCTKLKELINEISQLELKNLELKSKYEEKEKENKILLE